MELTSHDETTTARKAVLGKCASLLRDACQSLGLMPAHLITAISITCTLAGSAEDAPAVNELIKRLAEEYELGAQVQFHGRSLTACFRRLDGTGIRPTIPGEADRVRG